MCGEQTRTSRGGGGRSSPPQLHVTLPVTDELASLASENGAVGPRGGLCSPVHLYLMAGGDK